MLTDKHIEQLLYTKNIVQREGPVYKHACNTEGIMNLRCLTELGILRIVEGQGTIVYWEYIK